MSGLAIAGLVGAGLFVIAFVVILIAALLVSGSEDDARLREMVQAQRARRQYGEWEHKGIRGYDDRGNNDDEDDAA